MLNPAQTLLMSFVEGAGMPRDYKAPHAYRGTLPRLRKGRKPTVWLRNPATGEPVAKLRRLFKGHRP
jgi:hypothetical protein